MTFSIAIPVHNGAAYLKETLESAIAQTRPADEILVVDDASTDDSLNIVHRFQKDYEIRYVFNEHPTGFVDAWNRAIQLSTGDYVTLLHQDDLLDRRYLDMTERAFIQFPSAQHFFSGYFSINERRENTHSSPLPHTSEPELLAGAEYSKEYLHGVATNSHIHRCPGVTTRRSLLQRCSYRKEAGLIADDDFFIRVGHFTDVIGIRSPLASFRVHNESATARLESLAFRLAHDYVFSIRFHLSNREFIDDEGKETISRLASKFVTQLLFDGIRSDNEPWRKAALKLSAELDTLVPQWKILFAPSWSKILWRLIQRENRSDRLARYYCHFVEAAIVVKNFALKN